MESPEEKGPPTEMSAALIEKILTDCLLVNHFASRVPSLPVAANADANCLEWDVTTAIGNRLLGHEDQTVAAGHFHVDHGQAPDVALRDHRGQFFDVRLRLVKFRAGNCQGLSLEQLLLEVGVGKRCAIGSKEHVGILEKGRSRRH